MRTLTAPRLAVLIAAVLVAAWSIAGFRGEDWFNIERSIAGMNDLRSTLLGLNMPGFYRPLPDLVTGLLFASFGLTPGPYLATLLLLFVVDALLLAAIVRARGGSREAAWIAGIAIAIQFNNYAWTVFWFSYVTGSLMTTFVLLAIWLHHLAVAHAGAGRNPWPVASLAVPATVLAGMCKEEVVLLPVIVAALEAVRWRRLGPAERRTALGSWLAFSLVVAAYGVFRLTTHPLVVEGQSAHYQLRFGSNWISNLAFFAFHLLPFPLAMIAFAWWRDRGRGGLAPAAAARDELLAGAAWAAISIQLYLPMGGHAYGLLYLPAFGIALGLAPWLATVTRPAMRIAVYGCFALLMTGWGLVSVGWPRYRAIARDAFAALDRAAPTPRPGARFVFLDPMEPETLSGRSLFNMVFDGATANMVRLHYRRPDLSALLVVGPAALDSASHPPVAEAVFLVKRGRLERVDRGAQVAKRTVR